MSREGHIEDKGLFPGLKADRVTIRKNFYRTRKKMYMYIMKRSFPDLMKLWGLGGTPK